MNRIKGPIAGAATVMLTAAIAAPCLAGTTGSASAPRVQIEANSFKQVPAGLSQSNARIELSAQVNASDLDLAHAGDVAKLRRRVENAAEQVCAEIGDRYPGLVDSDDRADDAACVQGAVDDALSQIKMAALVARTRAGEADSRSG
ncbi:MAG TPA: UrcA family protein [Steroidobacteraceae bacterium]